MSLIHACVAHEGVILTESSAGTNKFSQGKLLLGDDKKQMPMILYSRSNNSVQDSTQ